jgi:predicted  nucleic acid-binding Zn-ribbon protein
MRGARHVRCSRCRHVFAVDKVLRFGCSICGVDALGADDYTIRSYKGSPYAICPGCAENFKGLLDERHGEESVTTEKTQSGDRQPEKPPGSRRERLSVKHARER